MKRKTWILKIQKGSNEYIFAEDFVTGEIIASQSLHFLNPIPLTIVNKLSLDDLKENLLDELNKQGYSIEDNVNEIDSCGFYILREKFEKEKHSWVLKVERNINKSNAYIKIIAEDETGEIITSQIINNVTKDVDFVKLREELYEEGYDSNFIENEFFDYNITKISLEQLEECFIEELREQGYDLKNIVNDIDYDGKYILKPSQKDEKYFKNWVLKFEKDDENDYLNLIAEDVETGEIIFHTHEFMDNIHQFNDNTALFNEELNETSLEKNLNNQGYFLENIVNVTDAFGNYFLKKKEENDNNSNDNSIRNYSDDELIQEIRRRFQRRN